MRPLREILLPQNYHETLARLTTPAAAQVRWAWLAKKDRLRQWSRDASVGAGSSRVAIPMDIASTPRVLLHLGQIVERIGVIQLAGVDQAHEQIAHPGTIQHPIEQRVFPVQESTAPFWILVGVIDHLKSSFSGLWPTGGQRHHLRRRRDHLSDHL